MANLTDDPHTKKEPIANETVSLKDFAKLGKAAQGVLDLIESLKQVEKKPEVYKDLEREATDLINTLYDRYKNKNSRSEQNMKRRLDVVVNTFKTIRDSDSDLILDKPGDHAARNDHYPGEQERGTKRRRTLDYEPNSTGVTLKNVHMRFDTKDFEGVHVYDKATNFSMAGGSISIG